MNELRVALCVVAVVVVAGWVALVVVASAFRGSFGASETSPVVIMLPPAVLALAFLSVVLPGQRWLLHATAVVLALCALGCLWLLRTAPFVAVAGLAYMAAWFSYYWQALHGAGAAGQ
jgi:hypothetical protein